MSRTKFGFKTRNKFNYSRIQMNRMQSGAWAIVCDGTEDDARVIRRKLTAAMVPWTNESDDLSLELVNPSVAQLCTARQIVSEMAQAPLRKEFF